MLSMNRLSPLDLIIKTLTTLEQTIWLATGSRLKNIKNSLHPKNTNSL